VDVLKVFCNGCCIRLVKTAIANTFDILYVIVLKRRDNKFLFYGELPVDMYRKKII
jgi:hypothetical protein